jgi:hypothetical protein
LDFEHDATIEPSKQRQRMAKGFKECRQFTDLTKSKTRQAIEPRQPFTPTFTMGYFQNQYA